MRFVDCLSRFRPRLEVLRGDSGIINAVESQEGGRIWVDLCVAMGQIGRGG